MKDSMRLVAKVFGAIYLILGGLLISNAISPTGLAIVDSVPDKSVSLTGIYLIVNGIALLALARKRKGQASMEFIMDYGWMILAVIGAIAIIATYTIFASNEISNSPPLLSAPMHSIGQGFNPATGEYQLQISTGIRGGADITNVVIPGCSVTNFDSHIRQGGSGTITATCPPNTPPRGEIIITWNNGLGGPTQTSIGTIGGPQSGGGSQGVQGGGPSCGNGLVEIGESCDDGDIVEGDGCSAVCTINSGWSCSEEPSTCVQNICGNGGTCSQDSDCNGFAQICNGGFCVENGEECDDGNLNNGDGCSSICVLTKECSDQVDNDGDTFKDYPFDLDCDDANGVSEDPVDKIGGGN